MGEPEFFKTCMGRQFFAASMPELVWQFGRPAEALGRPRPDPVALEQIARINRGRRAGPGGGCGASEVTEEKCMRCAARRPQCSRTICIDSQALGGGSALAFSSDLKATVLWVPSQNGFFWELPQRHREITVRPARSNLAPVASEISNVPVTLRGPWVITWTVVLLIVLPLLSPHMTS